MKENHCMTDVFLLSAQDSKVAKGAAVLLLLWHHLFYEHPEYGQIVHRSAELAKICVSIFLIISGYGLAKTFHPEENVFQFYRKRLGKLYATYWLVFVICVPISILFFGGSLKAAFPSVNHPGLAAFFQFLGLHMFYGGYGFNPTWWFMSAIIPLYVLFPFIYQAIDKYGWWGLLVCMIAFSFPGVRIPVIGGWLVPFTIGIFIAKYEWAKKSFMCNWLNSWLKLIEILALIFVLSLAMKKAGGYGSLLSALMRLDLALALLVIYGSACLGRHALVFNKSLSFLGEHSYTMFLTHTFLYYIWFPKTFYTLGYPVVIMIALTLASLLFALFFHTVQKTMSTIVRKTLISS